MLPLINIAPLGRATKLQLRVDVAACMLPMLMHRSNSCCRRHRHDASALLWLRLQSAAKLKLNSIGRASHRSKGTRAERSVIDKLLAGH